MSFTKLGLPATLVAALADQQYQTAYPIQAAAIPAILDKKNILGIAKTGSGKTASFVLPILSNLQGTGFTKNRHPLVLVLVPTRELAVQVNEVFKLFRNALSDHIRTLAVYGGVSINPQMIAMNGVQILVATPGRLLDLIDSKAVHLSNVKTLVLDEADKMLNMGFKDDLDTILAETPVEKQTLLFSATMPKEVMRISKNYMSNPKTIEVASRNEGTKNVDHHYYMVNARDKYKALRRICDVNPNIYGIVFCRTRRETADIADKLMQDGYNADAIHGELSQAQRDHVMSRFRQKKLQINNIDLKVAYSLQKERKVSHGQ